MSEFKDETGNQTSNGDLVFENSSADNSETEDAQSKVTRSAQQAEVTRNEQYVEADDKEQVHCDLTLDNGISEVNEGDKSAVSFDELSLGDSSASISDGPGYKSLIHPSEESNSKGSAFDDNGETRSCSSGSSFDSSSSSEYSTGSSKREYSEDTSQDLRLRPKKITLSLDLRDTSSEASFTDDSDVVGILRKDRTNRSTTTDVTFNSCNDVTQISSEESLSALTDGSSASEFRGSEREDSLPMSSDSVSTRSTIDIESGGIKDTRNRSRTGLAAGFVSLFGLGRFWLSPAKPKCRYDTSLEKKKLTDPDKSKATVAEIYPWIKEEEMRAKKEHKENKRQNKRKLKLLPSPEDIDVIEQC